MKRYLMAVVLVVLFAAPVFAANSVNVSGDLARDGNLMIDIDWTIDSAKFPGQTRDQIHEKVYQDIWNAMLPKLVKKADGYPVSFNESNFNKLSEQKTTIQERADGTKVVAYTAKVKFVCPRAQAAANASGPSKKEMDKQLSYRFVREGKD